MLINTIASLCAFYMYSPFTVPKNLETNFSVFHHSRCIYTYRMCVNKKMKMAKPSTFDERHLQDFLWSCLGEENSGFEIVKKGK